MKHVFCSTYPPKKGQIWIFKREELNVGTVPTFKMHNVGTVPTSKMHNIGFEFGLYGNKKD